MSGWGVAVSAMLVRSPPWQPRDGRRFRDGRDLAQYAGMAGVKCFEDLVAWKLAQELKLLVYDLCKRPAIARDLRFHGQLQDSAASGPRNIAEGFGRFRHADFARFARIGKSSEVEVLNHLRDACDRGYLAADELPAYEHAARKAIKVVNGLIRYLESTPDFR